MIGTVESDLGGLDVLINNAGTTRYAPPAELDARSMKRHGIASSR
jgi:NAD(P)-dependent dehydrogenase (short-subunit alcohol dehydrogenase family)